MEMAIAGIVLLGAGAINGLRRGAVPGLTLVLGLVALVPAVLGIPFAVTATMFVATMVGLTLVLVGLARAVNRAHVALDHEAAGRWSRIGFLLTTNPEWVVRSDLAAWRALAANDLAAARPLLEQVAHQPSSSQPYNVLVLEAVYGRLDVPALVDQRWDATSRRLRPLLLHLAIKVLVEQGRTTQALCRLGRAAPADVTARSRPLVIAEVAAATGDSDTLEAILAQDPPALEPSRGDILRAVADRARGLTEAGDQRLRALPVPPAGRAAQVVATCLQHPTPIFDEAGLDADARRGLDRYRELVRTSRPAATTTPR